MTVTSKFAHVVLQTNRVYESSGTCFVTFDDEHHRCCSAGPEASRCV